MQLWEWSQPLSTATTVLTQWAPVQRGMVAGMEILHGLTKVDFHSARPAWLPHSLSEQSANSGGQHRAPDMAPFLGGSASYLVAGWLYWAASITEGQHFVLIGTDTYSEYWCTFSVHMLPSKQPFVHFKIALFTVMHSAWHCFWSRNSLNRKGSVAIGLAHVIHWCFCVACHPEVAVLIEWRNGLLKTPLCCQIGGISFRAGIKFSKGSVSSESAASTSCYLSDSQDSRIQPGIKEWKWERYHSLLSLLIHQQNFTSCSHDFMLCWPRSLNSRVGKLSPGDATMSPLN